MLRVGFRVGFRVGSTFIALAAALWLGAPGAMPPAHAQEDVQSLPDDMIIEPAEPLHVHRSSLSHRMHADICRYNDQRSTLSGCKNLIASCQDKLDRLRTDYERGGGKAEYEDRRQKIEQQMSIYNQALERLDRPY